MNESKCDIMPDIRAKLNELNNVINNLSDSISVLKTRLDNVIRLEPTCNERDVKPIASGNCAMSTEIAKYVNTLTELDVEIKSITNLLEN